MMGKAVQLVVHGGGFVLMVILCHLLLLQGLHGE